MAGGLLPKFDASQVFKAKIIYSKTEGSMFEKAKAAIMGAYPKAQVQGEQTQKSGMLDIVAKGNTIFSQQKGDKMDAPGTNNMLMKLFSTVQGGGNANTQA
jgi:hypothetical protein